MIASLPERGGDLVESADVCVIGSGAGGAVAAAELAEGGRSVIVLEQGPHWTARDFTQREYVPLWPLKVTPMWKLATRKLTSSNLNAGDAK